MRFFASSRTVAWPLILLDLGEAEVAGGEEVLAGEVVPGPERPHKGGERVGAGEVLQRQPQPHRVDLGHAARHPLQLGLLVQLVAVGRVDTLELETEKRISIKHHRESAYQGFIINNMIKQYEKEHENVIKISTYKTVEVMCVGTI